MENKGAKYKTVLTPIAMAAIIIGIMLFPSGERYIGTEDIQSIEYGGVTISADSAIAEFMDALTDIVDKEDICFTKNPENCIIEGAELITVNQTPDKMEGIDNGESFSESIYHMYVCLDGDKLFFNGALYEADAGKTERLLNIFKEAAK